MQRSKTYLKSAVGLVRILKVQYRKSSNIICPFIQSPRLQLSDGTRKRILWQGKLKKKRKKGKLHKMIDSVDQLNIDSADVFCGTS